VYVGVERKSERVRTEKDRDREIDRQRDRERVSLDRMNSANLSVQLSKYLNNFYKKVI
jgi:hypothetical protein